MHQEAMANDSPAMVVSGIMAVTQEGSARQVLALIFGTPNTAVSLAVSRGMVAMWPRLEFKGLVVLTGWMAGIFRVVERGLGEESWSGLRK